MTIELVTEAAVVTVPARAAAVGWLNVFLVSSQDENRPALYRTLSLEAFTTGLQLIGCDGTAIFRTWVPGTETPDAKWPDMAEAPVRSLVVMDPDGFGLSFIRSLLRVTADDARLHEPLTLTTALADDAAAPALGSAFQSERLVLRSCGQRTDLRLFEDTYPDWRRVRLGMDVIERMDRLTIATRMFGLVGKLRGVDAIDVEFYGEKKHLAFDARALGGTTEVRGLLMPMRRPEKPVEE